MVSDRMILRVAMLLALAVLPSLASSQTAQSSKANVPDWNGREVTQITVDGSYQQLKAFQEALPAFITKGLADQGIFLSQIVKKKLKYSYLTENEVKLGESIVSGFYSALKASTEKAKDAKQRPVMHTSVFLALPCRPGSCAGQQAWIGRSPPCDC